jgi:hypothetical protein
MGVQTICKRFLGQRRNPFTCQSASVDSAYFHLRTKIRHCPMAQEWRRIRTRAGMPAPRNHRGQNHRGQNRKWSVLEMKRKAEMQGEKWNAAKVQLDYGDRPYTRRTATAGRRRKRNMTTDPTGGKSRPFEAQDLRRDAGDTKGKCKNAGRDARATRRAAETTAIQHTNAKHYSGGMGDWRR